MYVEEAISIHGTSQGEVHYRHDQILFLFHSYGLSFSWPFISPPYSAWNSQSIHRFFFSISLSRFISLSIWNGHREPLTTHRHTYEVCVRQSIRPSATRRSLSLLPFPCKEGSCERNSSGNRDSVCGRDPRTPSSSSSKRRLVPDQSTLAP